MNRLRERSLRAKTEGKAWKRLLDGLSFFLSLRAELSCGLIKGSLVLLCRRHTWDITSASTLDTITV